MANVISVTAIERVKQIAADNDWNDEKLIGALTAYSNGRDRAKRQREATTSAKEFAKAREKEFLEYKAKMTTNGGAHSAGSGGSTRKV